MGGCVNGTATGLVCRKCREPARLEGPGAHGGPLERALARAVHDATGLERGPDGHVTAPLDADITRPAPA